jgi:hypothetical protein
MPRNPYIISDTELSNDALFSQNLVPVGQTKTSARLGNKPQFLYLPGLSNINTDYGEISSERPAYDESIISTIRNYRTIELDNDEIEFNDLFKNMNVNIGGKSKKSMKYRGANTSMKSRKATLPNNLQTMIHYLRLSRGQIARQTRGSSQSNKYVKTRRSNKSKKYRK